MPPQYFKFTMAICIVLLLHQKYNTNSKDEISYSYSHISCHHHPCYIPSQKDANVMCINHIYFIIKGRVLIVIVCDLSTTYEIKYKDENNLFLLSYVLLLSPLLQ